MFLAQLRSTVQQQPGDGAGAAQGGNPGDSQKPCFHAHISAQGQEKQIIVYHEIERLHHIILGLKHSRGESCFRHWPRPGRCGSAGVSSPQGGGLTKSALVEALVSALLPAASASLASLTQSDADVFLARLRSTVTQEPGDGAASAGEKLERTKARRNNFLIYNEIVCVHDSICAWLSCFRH